MNKAVFLDRDGVITQDPPHYAHRIDQLKIIQKSAEAIKLLNENGYKVIVISNQAGVAKGYYNEAEIGIFNTEMKRRLGGEDAYIDAEYYCPHHPNGKIKQYTMACSCRKPRTGMLRQAEKDLDIDMKKSFLVGDKITDIEAGSRVHCKTILVLTGHGTDELIEKTGTNIVPDYVSLNLWIAVHQIISDGSDL